MDLFRALATFFSFAIRHFEQCFLEVRESEGTTPITIKWSDESFTFTFRGSLFLINKKGLFHLESSMKQIKMMVTLLVMSITSSETYHIVRDRTIFGSFEMIVNPGTQYPGGGLLATDFSTAQLRWLVYRLLSICRCRCSKGSSLIGKLILRQNCPRCDGYIDILDQYSFGIRPLELFLIHALDWASSNLSKVVDGVGGVATSFIGLLGSFTKNRKPTAIQAKVLESLKNDFYILYSVAFELASSA